MLKIKLARFGKKKQPHYRIVINEARDKRDGRYVDALGHYAPTMNPKVLTIDMVKYEDWRKKGAQPTETVAALVTRFQSGNPFPTKPARPSKKAKAKAEQAAAAAAEAAQAPAVEATEEAPTETTQA
jgi:small subunit ribosomal protein S16